ncbi:MAG: gamma-glutamylcyclotransferase [Deltaproteobacteria bacterium]|jgi:gamma-glutamylcyclotransferase (GGCT)/AIG2-like uncharacterized protein YtfP|nr:gamma-glutamylcyclotransferase [Deltaproteobacteria bacterium]
MVGQFGQIQQPVKIFVYGTLKRGFPNHELYIPPNSLLEPAWLFGWLFDTGYNFPTLVIAEENIRAQGSQSLRADLTFDPGPPPLEPPEPTQPVELTKVRGEVITLAEPGETLRRLDQLEGFNPAGRSMYRRVLTWVMAETITWAWVYVNGDLNLSRLIASGEWPG